MLEAVKLKRVRSVGLSNYYTEAEVKEVIGDSNVWPAIIQNENHLFFINAKLQRALQPHGVVLESYYPLGGRGHTHQALNHPVVKALAERHCKTPAQILLRMHLQAGYVAIPGVDDAALLAENINIFDFALTGEEMQSLGELNTNRRYENW